MKTMLNIYINLLEVSMETVAGWRNADSPVCKKVRHIYWCLLNYLTIVSAWKAPTWNWKLGKSRSFIFLSSLCNFMVTIHNTR